nr:uncharacterized protein LOC109190495 [Ipomoea trifida]
MIEAEKEGDIGAASGRDSPEKAFSIRSFLWQEMMSACVNSTRRFKSGAKHSSSPSRAVDKCGEDKQEDSDPEVLENDAADFEFRLDRPEIMLLADELFFSDGKPTASTIDDLAAGHVD